MSTHRPVRILFVSHDSGMSGAQRMLLTLLEGLNRDIFKPYVVAPYDGPLIDAIKLLDIPVIKRQLTHWVPSVYAIKGNNRFLHLIHVLRGLRARAWAIANLIERYQIDLVYTNTVTCIEGAVSARMSKKPHLWHIHEFISDNSELAPLLPTGLYSSVINTLSTNIIFPSKILAKAYKTLASKATVVYNGLPFPPSQDRSQARTRVAKYLGLDIEMKWVAIVGALQPRKDHFTFLRAAQKVLSASNDVVFLIVGSGSEIYLSRIHGRIDENNLQENVKLTGHRLGDIWEIMAAIDTLVISSEQESFGLTAIESLAMGTPVVSTRCGGPEEIIENGVNGYLVPVKDADAMANAILKLINNTRIAKTFGTNGKQMVNERFTNRIYVNSIQQVMLDTTGRSNAPIPKTNNPS